MRKFLLLAHELIIAPRAGSAARGRCLAGVTEDAAKSLGRRGGAANSRQQTNEERPYRAVFTRRRESTATASGAADNGPLLPAHDARS